jgi:hypothetical protein
MKIFFEKLFEKFLKDLKKLCLNLKVGGAFYRVNLFTAQKVRVQIPRRNFVEVQETTKDVDSVHVSNGPHLAGLITDWHAAHAAAVGSIHRLTAF